MDTTLASEPSTSLGEQIRTGLSQDQKELPCSYLYDEVGSALFEAITVLPEYGLTRAAERLMRRYPCELMDRLQFPLMVVELGSGSGKRTRWILEALGARQRTLYCPIEISPTALSQCVNELGSIGGVTVSGQEREYLDGLAEALELRRPGTHVLVLFLGSTIGNFPRTQGLAFINRIRELLMPGDSLLLATDLVKPVSQILLAYDDPIGVTAAFNLNLLSRLNREFMASFALEHFRHQARWNEDERRIEMHLRSLANQKVSLPGLELEIRFTAGETIWTESSHKYWLDEVVWMAQESGFRCAAQWVDEEWPFAHSLFLVD